MGDLIGEIADWMMEQKVEMTGPPYSVYYTSPAEVAPEDMQYEIGVPFIGEASESGKVKIKIKQLKMYFMQFIKVLTMK